MSLPSARKHRLWLGPSGENDGISPSRSQSLGRSKRRDDPGPRRFSSRSCDVYPAPWMRERECSVAVERLQDTVATSGDGRQKR